MNRIYVPTSSPEDWRMGLASPDRHWKQGYSAYELAHCWENARGFPREVGALFTGSLYEQLRSLELLLAIPEYEVSLPGRGHGSQTDLFVLAKGADGELVSIAVEGKVGESFDETLAEWGPDSTVDKRKRFACLRKALNLEGDVPGHIRYQLIHRTASAVILAWQFNASTAAMIVHSFSPEKKGFEDYCDFVALYGVDAGAGELVWLTESGGVDLYVGWATGINSVNRA
jgi:hypothetical protein